MNGLRFVWLVIRNALKFAFMGGLVGMGIGIVEGAGFGVLAAFGSPFGALFGGAYGTVQGIVCGTVSGLIVGGCRWADRDQGAMFNGLNVAMKTALLGGASGAATGMLLMTMFPHLGLSDITEQLFNGYLYGSMAGWCLCFVGGALAGGLLRSRPRSDTKPLDVLLGWLWSEKRVGKSGENLP